MILSGLPALGVVAPANAEDAFKPPILMKSVEPAYDRCERRPLRPTRVAIAVSVEGSVVQATVMRAITPCVALEIRKAVLQWRFSPALRDGKPTYVYFLMQVPSARPVPPTAIPRENV